MIDTPQQIVRVDSPHLCSQTAILSWIHLRWAYKHHKFWASVEGLVFGHPETLKARTTNPNYQLTVKRVKKKNKHRVVKEDEFTA